VVLCETFFRVVGKITHVLSLFYYVSEYILRAFSLSLSLSLTLSLSLVVIIAQRRHERGRKDA